MDAGCDIAQCLMHRPVARHASHCSQYFGPDQHGKVALTRAIIPRMAGVTVAFIHHIQPRGLKGCLKPLTNFAFKPHETPFTLLRKSLNLRPRVGKAKAMSKSPFEFDLRVSSDKAKRKTTRRGGMSGAFETSQRACDFPDCKEKGAYRAPKSPDHLDDFFWFCRDHIREYNLKWNFFGTATDEEFQKLLEKDRLWERETRPFSKKDDGRAWQRLGVNDPMALLGEKATQNPGRVVSTATRKLPPTERKAVEILEARDTWTKAEIRKAYKGLIKVLHPDMNGGDRRDEERLQEVVWAWDQIKDSRYFKD